MQKKERWKYAVVVGLLFVLIAPFLYTYAHSLPTSDDFLHFYIIRERAQDVGYLKAAWDETVDGVMVKGFYPSTFFYFWVFPLFFSFGLTGLRIVVVAADILFLAAALLFFKQLTKYLCRDERPLHSLALWFLFLCYFVGYRINSEVFSWMICSVNYLAATSCIFIGISFFLKALSERKKSSWILTALFGMLSACSSTHITAMACGAYLLVLPLVLMQKKPAKGAVIVTLLVFAVGVACLCSPGLYVRHDWMEEGYSIASALRNTIKSVTDEAFSLLRSPFILVLCAVFFFALRWFSAQTPLSAPGLALIAVYCLVAPFVVAFPNFLGYSMLVELPNRGAFVVDIQIVASCFVFLIALAGFIRQRIAIRPLTQTSPLAPAALLALGLMLFSFSVQSVNPKDVAWLCMTNDIVDGDMARSTRYWEEQLATWQSPETDGQTVVIYYEDILNNLQPYLQSPGEMAQLDVGISWNSEDWINYYIAKYYRLESLKLEWLVQ